MKTIKNTPIYNNQSRLFDISTWLRFVLPIAVISIHSTTYSPTAYENAFVDSWIYFARIAVPLFFFLSGLLFFREGEFNFSIYANKLKRRTRTIIFPYILWNIIAFLVFIIIYNLGMGAQTMRQLNVTDENVFAPLNIFNYCLGLNLINGPLWFIRDLILLFFITPIIHYVIKKTGIIFLIIAGIYYVTVKKPISTQCITDGVAVFWFSLGSYFSIKQIDIIEKLKQINLIAVTFSLFFIFIIYSLNKSYSILVPNNLFNVAAIAVGIIFCFKFFDFIVQKSQIPTFVHILSNISFFVYCGHLIFGRIATKTSSTFYPKLPIQNFATNTTTFLVVIFSIYLITIAVYAVLKKLSPKIASILNGGR